MVVLRKPGTGGEVVPTPGHCITVIDAPGDELRGRDTRGARRRPRACPLSVIPGGVYPHLPGCFARRGVTGGIRTNTSRLGAMGGGRGVV